MCRQKKKTRPITSFHLEIKSTTLCNRALRMHNILYACMIHLFPREPHALYYVIQARARVSCANLAKKLRRKSDNRRARSRASAPDVDLLPRGRRNSPPCSLSPLLEYVYSLVCRASIFVARGVRDEEGKGASRYIGRELWSFDM